MAKQQITHTCGHNVTHDIIGTDVHGERARKAAWFAGHPCPDCAQAAKAAAHKAAAVAAAGSTEDMVALTGSEKQVAWATTIRATARTAVEAVFAAGPALNPAQVVAINALWAQDAAGWWIDRRDNAAHARAWLIEAAKLQK